MNHPLQKEKWCIHLQFNKKKQIKYSKHNIIKDKEDQNINKSQKSEYTGH